MRLNNSGLERKNRLIAMRAHSRFSAYKCSPYPEDMDPAMRRFETGYRSHEKPWLIVAEHEHYQR